MARIQIEALEHSLFQCNYQLRVSDMNYGGHFGNDAVLSLMHDNRCAFLAHFGYSEFNIENVSIIMGDVAIQYQSEGFLHNTIEVKIGIRDISRVSFDMIYQITNLSTLKPLAIAKTGIICYNYSERKVVSIPEGVRFLQNSIQ